MKYAVVYIDPPWDYKGQKQHGGKGASDTGGAASHYGTVKLARLKTFPMASLLADDALVFMWVTSPHLDQGIDLLRAWGLKYATVAFVWDKGRVNPGFYTMSQVELCLVAKRGRIPQPRGARNVRQYVESPREAHSKKPDEVRRRIEQMFPDVSRLEIFARGSVEGWDTWGNQTNCTPSVAAYLAVCGWSSLRTST